MSGHSNYRWWVNGCPKCDDIRICFSSSSDLQIIAERLGIQPASVIRHLERHGQHRLIDAISNKWVSA